MCCYQPKHYHLPACNPICTQGNPMWRDCANHYRPRRRADEIAALQEAVDRIEAAVMAWTKCGCPAHSNEPIECSHAD